jgi:hypothetical protein
LLTDGGSMPLRAGERATAWDNAVPGAPQIFNSARLDAFDRWTAQRRDERLGSSRSTQYLPADLRMYGGALDRSGTWEYESDYGYVWYPGVAPDWRPYYDGYWSDVPTYGWTWIGVDLWAWPTHHYGRWGYGRNRWFWIPDRRWAPAWVSWGGAPGYVSWCPLDYHNRPIFSLSVSSGRGWNGWTTVSRDHFGDRGRSVRNHAIAPRALAANTPFIAQTAPPPSRARAIPRRGSGSAAASVFSDTRSSGFAVPRTQATAPPFERRPVDGDRAITADERRVERRAPRQDNAPSYAEPRRGGSIGAGERPAAMPQAAPNPSAPQARPQDGGPTRRAPLGDFPRASDTPRYATPRHAAPITAPPAQTAPAPAPAPEPTATPRGSYHRQEVAPRQPPQETRPLASEPAHHQRGDHGDGARDGRAVPRGGEPPASAPRGEARGEPRHSPRETQGGTQDNRGASREAHGHSRRSR